VRLLLKRRLKWEWNKLVSKFLSSVIGCCYMGKLPGLKIGGLELATCVIQGGMGVGVSLSGLAPAVTNMGGLGVLATVGIGLLKRYPGSYVDANVAALRDEIKESMRKSNGVIGVNVMCALSDYENLVQTTVEEGVPLLFTGAGFDENFPEKIKGSDTLGVPIVSYGRFAGSVCAAWGKHGYVPAAIVIEGPKAGGHLGYSRRKLGVPGFIDSSLEKEVKRAVEVVKKFGDIPIIAAGGIYTGADIYEALKWGARGVQMGTRFVATDECDADIKFKEEYLRATESDIVFIDSPVGFPGSVIENDFVRKFMNGKSVDFSCRYKCLKNCNPNESLFCIADALINAQRGNLREGFAFAGANAYRCNEIVPVKKLMECLSDEYSEAVRADKK